MSEIRDELHRTFEDQEAKIAALEARCERYREALVFYANPAGYQRLAWASDGEPGLALHDKGEKARAALSEEDESDG